MSLRIYGLARTRAFRALWIAEELALAYEHRPIEIGEAEAGRAVVGAIERVLAEKTLRTRDLGGNADTVTCGKAVAEMVE